MLSKSLRELYGVDEQLIDFPKPDEFVLPETAAKYIERVKTPQKYVEPNYHDAKRTFLRFYDEGITKTGKQTIIDDELADILPQLILWFLNRGRFSSKKGLFLAGAKGRSKTQIIRALQKMADFYKMPKQFNFCDAPAIFDACQYDRDFNITKYYDDNLCIDDVGFSEPFINSFGNIIRPIESILRSRYNRFVASGQLTHVTTNLSVEQLKVHFDERILDRFNEMFNIIVFKGDSFRKA